MGMIERLQIMFPGVDTELFGVAAVDGECMIQDWKLAVPQPTAEQLAVITDTQVALWVARRDLEVAVGKHIRATCITRGYDDENSLSKYMARPNSAWYAESVALGDWIDACWLKCHEVMQAVVAGTREIPTADTLIAELPSPE